MRNGHCTVRLCGSNMHAYNPGLSFQKEFGVLCYFSLTTTVEVCMGKYALPLAHLDCTSLYAKQIFEKKKKNAVCSLMRDMECLLTVAVTLL